MKNLCSLLLALAMIAALLGGCGGGRAEAPLPDVDLEAFMTDVQSRYELGSIEKADDALIDAFYPGLRDIDAEVRLVYLPLITGVVSEYALLRCRDAEGAKQAGELLRARVQAQAEGGAWYPESMESWAKAKVIVRDRYAVLIAAGDATEAIAADLDRLF